MKRLFACTLLTLGLMAGIGWAGSLDSPAAPTDAASAMPTVNGIYDRLTIGAAGTARTGPFVEPTAGPAPSSHTLTEVLNAAPAADNTNGAVPGDVKSGKTFWSLRTDGAWGLLAGTSLAPVAMVPETGQNTCYDASGGVIACAGTGQDGALRAGVSWPNPRFTDVGNGTVTDNLTGLIWLKSANCTDTVGGVLKASGMLTWANALSWCNKLANGNCGLTDGSTAGAWRLPSIAELESLVDPQYASPALSNASGTVQWTSGNPFLAVQADAYWSSSTYVLNPPYAWGVNLPNGYVVNYYKGNTYYVWPVRGGE